MARETSINVYREIENNGLLQGLLWITYQALFKFGPATQMELCRHINDSKVQDRSIMPRFAQLKKFGAIKEIGLKKCSITGREVLLWDVTDLIPTKISRIGLKKIFFGVRSKKFGDRGKLFKTRDLAIKYINSNKFPQEILEFEVH